MTSPSEAPTTPQPQAVDGRRGRWPLIRWFIASATFTVPQAAGPVAFSLVALSLTGDTSGGAAMILAMTLAQVVGAIPMTRLGRSWSAATYLKLLIVFRAAMLAAVTVAAHLEAPFAWLIALAALAGSVNGAAFGYLRAILNQLAPASRLPRALGIAATLNELTFVLAPVAASLLSTVAPAYGVLALTVLSLIPALMIPQAGDLHVRTLPQPGASVLSPPILIWLACAAAGGSTVAAFEIGAVALALEFGYEPALAILFTVPLCLASVAGGIFVSVRNRASNQKAVVAKLATMTLGATLAALEVSLVATIVGAVLIGAVIAPLGTHYSLVLDRLAPPHKRPEVFALLRTAHASGIIFASAILTTASISSALVVVTVAMVAVTLTVAIAGGRPQPAPGEV